MKRFFISALPLAIMIGTTGMALAGDITLEQARARATPGGARVGAGFVTIKNTGTTGDRLMSATSDRSGRTEIHEMAIVDGVMQMRPLKSLDVPAGQTLELKPGGYHIMLLDLKQPLKAGESVRATLNFEKSGAMPVEFKVESMADSMGQGKGH